MNAHRVEIFHVADCDAVVGTVPDRLILYFFPSAQIFLDKHLSHGAEDFGKLRDEFLLAAYDSRALAAKRESRANHDGVSNLPGCRARSFDIDGCTTSCRLSADFPELPHKEVAVLGVVNSRNGSAEDFHTVLF